MTLKHGKIFKEMETWGPDFRISFEIQPLDAIATVNGWLNVFHMTATNNNCCGKGDRMPGVWVIWENGPKLRVDITMPSHKYHKEPLVMNQFHNITMIQRSTSEDKGVFTLWVDGKVSWEEPTTPVQYKHVTWYMSAPWDQTAENKVTFQNLSFSNDRGQLGQCGGLSIDPS